jgi:predicted transporter
MLLGHVVTGLGALGTFAYYLSLRNVSAVAGRWAILSGVLTIVTGSLNLTLLLKANQLRGAVSLRTALIVSMPCPLILAGLTLIGVGFDSDLGLLLGSGAAVSVFLAGVVLFVRYVYVTAKKA